MKPFVGKYSGGDEEKIFEIHNGNLVLIDDENSKSKLIPVGEKKFISKDNNNLYEFLTGKSNKTNYVHITNSNSYNNDYRKQ